MQPQIILLREGTDDSQGIGQCITNINACEAVVDIVRTTLGPRGMDKLITKNKTMTITNDGATVMKLLDVSQPAARTLVEIAMAQDAEVGDGTTSVVVLAGELLEQAKKYVEDGVHPQIIIRAYRAALEQARLIINGLAVKFDKSGENGRRFVENCAATSMQSKLIAHQRAFFTKFVVDAVYHLDDDLDIDMIGVKKETGGALEDSFMVKGVAFKKTFSYAGFEQQPKFFTNPKIICLNIELELKQERENAEIRVNDPKKYQEFVDAEWKIIYGKLDAIVQSGAQIVLSKLAIGDLATQYFADRKIFCAGRVPEDDLRRVCKATGAQVQTTVSNLIPSVLGTCGRFEERQVGKERYNVFSECTQAKSVTIVLRGGGSQFLDEAERSLHDSIMVARRTMKHNSIVAGGGATELEVSKRLKEYALTITGKEQMLVEAFAKALEVIPRQLADNAGYDSTMMLNQLRKKHYDADGTWYGVDVFNESVCDAMERNIWEPALVKINAITAATEACCTILSIDESVTDTPSQPPSFGPTPGRGGMRGGMRRGMRGGMRGGMM